MDHVHQSLSPIVEQLSRSTADRGRFTLTKAGGRITTIIGLNCPDFWMHTSNYGEHMAGSCSGGYVWQLVVRSLLAGRTADMLAAPSCDEEGSAYDWLQNTVHPVIPEQSEQLRCFGCCPHAPGLWIVGSEGSVFPVVAYGRPFVIYLGQPVDSVRGGVVWLYSPRVRIELERLFCRVNSM